MKRFDYEKAESIAQAVELLSEKGSRAIAGGSAVLLRMKHEMLNPEKLVGIGEIEELKYIREEAGEIRIGAGVSLHEIEKNELLSAKAPLLCRVAKEIGSVEVRNMGTIGGNLCASAANCGCCFLPGCPKMTAKIGKACRNAAYADMLLPLVAYEAKVKLVSKAGEREICVEEVLDANQKLTVKADELLTEIRLKSQEGAVYGYSSLRRPVSMGLPLVAVVAKEKENGYELTIGGSVRGIVKKEADGNWEEIVAGLVFNECLMCEDGYRERVAGQVIRRAVEDAKAEVSK